ncbi:hypothetical protein HF086_009005 [Spodoptera exigua]|uniref:Uncharacterized protein n=1 Tax=Spodoptera exigua TaxID=7107 RepID=A0A922M3M6_SPOEX|nr:hypothetical protein HF086_009005 [Spodoptera exigua]
MPKKDNSNMSIRSSTHYVPENTNINVTMRRNKNLLSQQNIQNENESGQSIDEILGDTMKQITDSPITAAKKGDITLEQISLLLDSKLEKIKTSIIEDIKNAIQIELNNATIKLQNQVDQITTNLTNEQEIIKKQITTIDQNIENIEKQLYQLKNSNKIVLYGLTESHRETEYELIDRVSRVFHEVMNININPYIEEVKRIGERGDRRPLAIELMNKRMSKYITENARDFQNTGLGVGPFMDPQTLQQRNELREALRKARRSGKHAIIKNNKLYINGKEYITDPAPLLNTTHEPPIDNKNYDTTTNPTIHYETMTNNTQEVTPAPAAPSVSMQRNTPRNRTFRY